MTSERGARLRVALIVVAVAARIVGRRRMSAWRREWEAELWVAAERGRPVVRDALGAFRHAFTIRRHVLTEAPAGSANMVAQIPFSWLDVKLGLRMLAKYPGLSSISVIGMSVAIAIGAGTFSIMAAMTETTLPLPEGDRVVALRNAIITEPGPNRASLRDFLVWRDELKSVQDVAAFTTAGRNLIAPGVPVDLVRVSRMTASGFRVARTAPVLGRPLLAEDERSDARVVVIGFDEWQRRFAANPDIIGRRVRLGSDEYTIVGVMPEGFRFPIDDRYWIPFVIGPATHEQADEVSVTIGGRLADGETLEGAQAELSIIGTRMAAAYPDTYEQLRPRVLHYTRAFFDIDSPAMIWTAHLFRLFTSLLLVVVAVNVAILVYARTATRVGEIAVRSALGASRARVATQLFAEALVLSGTGALVGLAIAGATLTRVQIVAERELGELPFWVELGLSPGVVVYALVLAVVGAAIVGVVPALKATGRRVQSSLQQLSGRSTGMQLGRAWTGLIIAQVAVAVAVLPFAVHLAAEIVGSVRDPGYAVDEFLEASLAMQGADVPQDTGVVIQRFRAGAAELIRRLENDPAVAGLAVGAPGSYARIEVQGADGRPIVLGRDRIDLVEPGFFALFGMPIVAGRDFADTDARAGATAVIVNQIFTEKLLRGGAVLGRRIRVVGESADPGDVEAGPWLDIIGVVRDLESDAYEPADRIYRPADIAQLSPPVSLRMRVRVDPAVRFAPQLRDIGAAIDPALQLTDVVSAKERYRRAQQVSRAFGIGAMAAMLSVLLLSAAGVHAMMSFTVARRRREIGIRSALGAQPRRVLTGIFARASAQLAAGILLGLIGTIALDRMTGKGPVNDGNMGALAMVALLMTTVGLLAAIGPARSSLAIQPTEALREE